jgi:hypothetical protein
MTAPRPNSSRRTRQWTASRGGNRLRGIRQLLIGDANALAHLSSDHPRKRIALAKVRFLELEPADGEKS